MKKKRIFVTGGEGFIGSVVIHKLVKKAHEVASFDAHLNFIDNDPYYRKCFSLRKKIYMKPSKSYFGDIRDSKALKRAIDDFHPNVIVHLAALPMARVHRKFEDQIIPINLAGTLNVLEAYEKSNAEKLIYTSSSMAYGHFRQTPQSEDFILNPINSYGACKAAGEYFVKLSQKDWVIVRPTSVYGFTDCANRVSQLLIDAACLKRPAWVVRGETLDFSYVDDVADGFVLAILKPAASRETFNISRGEARAASEFAEILKEYSPDFQYEIRDPQLQQVYRGPQDIQKAQRLLGFDPKYSLEKGVKKVLQLIKEYGFYTSHA
jgi:UDP-glucose 4-epimerase